MEHTELKDCPFCGEKKRVEIVETGEPDNRHGVLCDNCMASGPMYSIETSDKSYPINAWNQRTDTQLSTITQQRDELLEALAEIEVCHNDKVRILAHEAIEKAESIETPTTLTCSLKEGEFVEGERNG